MERNYQNSLGATPVENPDVGRISQELAAHLSAISDISAQLGKLTTELFGPPPPSAISGEGVSKGGPGVIDQIHGQIQEIHNATRDLGEIASRLNRLV